MVQMVTSGFGAPRNRSSHLGGRNRLLFRLAVGLAQGLSLYGLHLTGRLDDIEGPLSLAWVMLTVFAPPLWLLAVGQISIRATLIWCSIVSVVIALLGISSGAYQHETHTLLVLSTCLPAALFCAHHLAVPAINNRSLLAPYEAYYEAAWKAGIQLALALLFLGIFWLILFLGALLFNAIGIDAVEDVITSAPFALIATPVFFALGIELSDVRDSLTQGIRTVVLTLLSWLLPIAVFIAAAFLIALPIAGMSQLQTSLSPAALMLTAAAGLIVLINTVYQDGADHTSPSRILRGTLRIGALLLLPLTAYALWAVFVRTEQYGLTLARVIAMAAAVIGFLYALGYSLGLLVKSRNGGWLPLFELSNIVVGIITTLLLLGFSTPWLNPVQLAINDQIARVRSGTLSADTIPYRWLYYSGGEQGQSLLEELKSSPDAEIARQAELTLKGEGYDPATESSLRLSMAIAGQPLPDGLADAVRIKMPTTCNQWEPCTVRLYDIDTDGREDVLILYGTAIKVFSPAENGTWTLLGDFVNRNACFHDRVNPETFAQSAINPAPPPAVKPVIIGSETLDFRPQGEC